ncbi:hypothetical protein [Stenotrophomonas sp. PS02289]|uniref:hypothetical protein n=1 Tax=Stenotrophomonas sp. PS02289 TaxID=2991422 RepID=UPI00249B9546|nr:hypothetical protein [Stenotrophomonas sp. PS02289]
MLKSFPEQALNFAVGGVISPSALGQAARADQLVSMARRRAADVLDAVPAQVAVATEQARRDGYHDGYAEAVAEAVPLLEAALADVQTLREAVLGQLRAVIAASLAAESVEAELVIRRCEQAFADGETDIRLHVPPQLEALRDAVRQRLAQHTPMLPLQVLGGQGTLPVLSVGALVYELDPVHALSRAVEASVDANVLEAGARERASAYLAAINARLKPLPFPDSFTGAH